MAPPPPPSCREQQIVAVAGRRAAATAVRLRRPRRCALPHHLRSSALPIPADDSPHLTSTGANRNCKERRWDVTHLGQAFLTFNHRWRQCRRRSDRVPVMHVAGTAAHHRHSRSPSSSSRDFRTRWGARWIGSIRDATGYFEDHVWFEDRWMVASLCDE
jgi:hypothetical protein